MNDIHKLPTLVPPPAPLPTPVGRVQADDEINFREILQLLYAGRWIVAAVAGAALAIGVLYLIVARPVYLVDGIVQVEQSASAASPYGNPMASSMGSLGSLLFGTPVQAEAEIQILQSRLVLDRVIDQMHLLVEAEPKYFPIFGRVIAHWNRRASAPVRAPPLLGGFAWGGERITVSRFEAPEYWYNQTFTLTATAGGGYRLRDPDGNTVITGRIGQVEQANTLYGPVQLEVQELTARPGERFRVIRFARETVLDDFQKKLTVQQLGNVSLTSSSGVMQISYYGYDKDRITRIIDTLENAYLAQDVRRRSLEAQQSITYLQAQLPTFKAAVDAAQADLARYQEAHGAPAISTETELLLKQNVELETNRLQLVERRAQALRLFTPEHPEIQAIDRQIALIAQDERALQSKIGGLPSLQQNVLTLMRNVEVSNGLYTAMMTAVEQFEVAKAGTVGDVRIVDYALEPFKPVAPKKPLVLAIALLFGVFLGSVYVVIQRALLRGVDNPAEIERELGLSVLVAIPYIAEQHKIARATARGEHGSHVLASLHSQNPGVEALRSLRTSLHFTMMDAANNIILLTGPAPGIGKSFVCANFGAVLAQSGKRVVLVDVDLRKGYLERYFSLRSSPGVSDYIAGDVTLEEVVQRTEVTGLNFIARGQAPPNPAELLMHERFSQLLAALSASHDYVLLDSPPVLAVADAAIVGKRAGTTLVVLKSAEHPMREIEETVKRLNAAGIRPRGIVMNQVGHRLGSYGYGNYGYANYRYDR
ncbi:MAG TPA: polysaccharide biosynthesis tyrosine autokinase [Steroidobacteraceae bacterium]|nr:polysaccharide biosynthesis tyrosine autokinase [Steroidobacteraceae bacterium]